jgi:glycine/D-amino acid oxidase-like deaminating enzyme
MGLGGCATGSGRSGTLVLAPVRASWDRVIRTTVGLRPHRPAGFVLRAEKLDAKTVIHNYGHGGSGMSLSWGTAFMAAEIATARAAGQEDRRVAVIGCGVVGLTTARQLQRRGFDVTIYALAVPPNTTSNMSLAGFTPTSGLVETDQRTRAWDAQFRRAVGIAYKQLQLLVGPKYGISWGNGYSMLAGPPANAAPQPEPSQPTQPSRPRPPSLLPAEYRTGSVVLGPGEHPFPTPYVSYRPSIRIEPSIYLDALVEDVLLFGGRIVIRKFDTPQDLMSLEESVIVNCTGLGSSTLFNDRGLMPLKGQLTVLVPQPEVDYATFGGISRASAGGFGIHMQPRSDGIVLGGTSERGIWSLEPNEEARERVVQGHIELFDAMRSGLGRLG